MDELDRRLLRHHRRLEDKLEAIEDSIFSEEHARRARELQHDLFGVRRELLQLRRAVVPLREVLSAILRREVQWIDGDALVDVPLRVRQVAAGRRSRRRATRAVGNAVDAHLAVISNQMNFVMKKLTAWGSIVFGATLIAGIYGMNFTHMPELQLAASATRWRLGMMAAAQRPALADVPQTRLAREPTPGSGGSGGRRRGGRPRRPPRRGRTGRAW